MDREEKAILRACQWLRDFLKSGPIYEEELRRAAYYEESIKPETLRAAKKRIGCVATNVNVGNKNARFKLWMISLPDDDGNLLR